MRKAAPVAIALKENKFIRNRAALALPQRAVLLCVNFVTFYLINIFLSIVKNCLLFVRGRGIIKG